MSGSVRLTTWLRTSHYLTPCVSLPRSVRLTTWLPVSHYLAPYVSLPGSVRLTECVSLPVSHSLRLTKGAVTLSVFHSFLSFSSSSGRERGEKRRRDSASKGGRNRGRDGERQRWKQRESAERERNRAELIRSCLTFVYRRGRRKVAKGGLSALRG